MKIFQVISRLGVGGAALYTILLTSKLQKKGHESSLISGQVSPSEGNMLDLMSVDSSLNHIYIPELGREISPWKDLIALIKLTLLFLRERPDVVHTHGSKAGFVGRLSAFFAGVPVRIHSFHGTIFQGYFHWFKSRLFTFFEKLLALLTDCIFTDADSIGKELIKLSIAPREKIKTMPIGLDLSQFDHLAPFRGRLREKLNLAGDVALVGIVSRLVPIKGVDVFLKAAQKVQKEKPKVHFVIAGDGELRGDLERLCDSLGLRNHVSFLGFWQDLRELYADFDIVVLSSFNEGCPISILEAMASEKPIVASAVGGVSDVVSAGRTGLMVSANDPEVLANGVLQVLNHPSLAKDLARNAKKEVFEKFHIDVSVRHTEDLYLQLRNQRICVTDTHL